MGWRSRLGNFIAGPPNRKQDDAMRAILAVGPYSAKWMQTDYETFAREGYAGNAYVYACIRQIAMAVAGIPWKVYDSDQKKKTFAEHPLLNLIHRPNPRQSQGKFFETMVGYLFLDGNNYIERAGGAATSGPPDELYCLRPDRVTIIPGTILEPVAGYKYKVGSQEVAFPAERVLQQKFFNPLDDWYGLSPMQAASRSVDQSNYATSWNVALLQNGAKPTGALQTPLAIDDVQYQRLKGMIEEQYTGFANAGRPIILEGGLQWQEMGMSPLDMAWLDSQKLSARQIAMIFNIAPELIGDPDAKTFCLTGDTIINTSLGPQRIDEVAEGQIVWAMDDEGRCPASVQKSWRSGVKEVLRVTGRGLDIKATPEHRFWVTRAISQGQGRATIWKSAWIEARNLQPSDLLILSRQLSADEDERVVSEDIAELCGAFLGDGCTATGSFGICGSWGPVLEHYATLLNNMGYETYYAHTTLRVRKAVSSGAVKTFADLGITGTAKTKRIPEWVWGQSDTVRRAFLRGLWDTDGSVDKYGHVSYTSVSYDLASDVRELALSLGIRTSPVASQTSTTLLPQGDSFTGIYNSVSFGCSSENALVGSRDLRDAARLQEASHRKVRQFASGNDSRSLPRPPRGCEYVAVRAVQTQDGAVPVYELTTTTHTFFANHVLVHNSNYAEARKALYEENILPLMDWLRDDLNQWLAPLYDSQTYIDYDRDEIEALSEDRNEIATRNNASFAAGWITINDARKSANMALDSQYGKFYRWQLPSFAAMDPLAEQPQVNPAPAALLPHPELPPTHPFNQPAGQEGNPAPGQSPAKPQEGVAKPTPTKPAVRPGAKESSEGPERPYVGPSEAKKAANGHSKSADDELMEQIARMR